MSFKTLEDYIEKNFEEVVEIRREIHRHPEMGRQEVQTSALIREKLEEYGVDKIESPVPTAVVALIHGGKGPGKCVALRADIDALPVTEETGLPYASRNEGVMHACGHDMHTAMLLGTAKLLCSRREEFAGTVKLIFQHSEDSLPGGAKELVEKGVMENPHVDGIFGMHVYPDESKVGVIGLHAGPMTTSVDVYDFTVKGKAGHGSAPHTAKDSILAACQMVVLLQQIPARYIDPSETVVFPVSLIQGGEAINIVSEKTTFSGVSRAYKNSVREDVDKQVNQIAKGVEVLSGCKVEIDHYAGYPACYNDEALINLAREAIQSELGSEQVLMLKEPMAFSEDFSYYTEMAQIPGAYMILYAGHMGELNSLHNPKCALQEEAMKSGIAAMSQTALAYLA